MHNHRIAEGHLREAYKRTFFQDTSLPPSLVRLQHKLS